MTKRARLGDKARDEVSGYEGIVVCISSWLNGCRRVTMQSDTKNDGRPIDAWTADESDVVLLERDPLGRRPTDEQEVPDDLLKTAAMAGLQPGRPGGDRPNPARAPDPK